MSPEELRLECLKLVLQSANASGSLIASGEIISRARAYADFVMDRSGLGSIGKANSAQNLEPALEEGFQVPAPAFPLNPTSSPAPTLIRPARRMAAK